MGPTLVAGRYLRTGSLPTVGSMSVVRVPTSVPAGADRHSKVPTCADRDRRGRRLRGAVPPVPRGFVGTKFAIQGYSEVMLLDFINGNHLGATATLPWLCQVKGAACEEPIDGPRMSHRGLQPQPSPEEGVPGMGTQVTLGHSVSQALPAQDC
jgi:hypothetical protein